MFVRTNSAGIHSLLTLLVGAGGKHTARARLCESTARITEAARVNSVDPHSGIVQSKTQRVIIIRIYGNQTNCKARCRSISQQRAGEKKILLGIQTRAGWIQSNKSAPKTHGQGWAEAHSGLVAGGWLSADVWLSQGSWSDMTDILWPPNQIQRTVLTIRNARTQTKNRNRLRKKGLQREGEKGKGWYRNKLAVQCTVQKSQAAILTYFRPLFYVRI